MVTETMIPDDIRLRINNAGRHWLSSKTDEYLALARFRRLTDQERAIFIAMCDRLDKLEATDAPPVG